MASLSLDILVWICTIYIQTTTAPSAWITSTQLLADGYGGAAIGEYNGTIFIVGGGEVSEYTMNLDTYHIATDTLTHFPNAQSPRELWPSNGQAWTQHNHLLYIFDWANYYEKIIKYNMMTRQLSDASGVPNSRLPVEVRGQGCFSSDSHYLYISGGEVSGSVPHNKLQIYDFSTNNWVIGTPPSMIETRASHSCAINGGYLWAIGGDYGVDFGVTLSNIERISLTNIMQNAWELTSYSLSEPLRNTRAVAYGDMIYILGGKADTSTDAVHEIDVKAGSITEPRTYQLPMVSSKSSPIIVDSTLYIFKGFRAKESGATLRVQKDWAYLPLPTLTPTSGGSFHPTVSPTNDPTQSPSVPSVDPTVSPSMDPTETPSSNPTFPTEFPSSNPSASPSMDPTPFPSVNPTVSPTMTPTLPTGFPSANPTQSPLLPSVNPSGEPSIHPSVNPSAEPSIHPSVNTSANPTVNPSDAPIANPFAEPSMNRTTEYNVQFTIEIELVSCTDDGSEPCAFDVTEDEINTLLIAYLDDKVSIIGTVIEADTVKAVLSVDGSHGYQQLDRDQITNGIKNELEREYGQDVQVTIYTKEEDESIQSNSSNDWIESWMTYIVVVAIAIPICLIISICLCCYSKRKTVGRRAEQMVAMETTTTGGDAPSKNDTECKDTECEDNVFALPGEEDERGEESHDEDDEDLYDTESVVAAKGGHATKGSHTTKGGDIQHSVAADVGAIPPRNANMSAEEDVVPSNDDQSDNESLYDTELVHVTSGPPIM